MSRSKYRRVRRARARPRRERSGHGLPSATGRDSQRSGHRLSSAHTAGTTEIRPITEDELPELQRITTYAFGGFGGQPPPWIHPDWTTCAFVDGRIATTFGAWPFRIRLNGRSTAVAGVTMVATLPEHR